MKPRITYDIESKLAYLYTLSSTAQYKIQLTDELEVNEYLELDIDEQDRVVGIEVFGPIALELSKLAGFTQIYTKDGGIYSFRLNKQEVNQKFHYKGIDFCFSDEKFESFVGLDIVDLNKYDISLLDQILIP